MKKLLAILLAAMMLLSLAACTNNDDNPSGSENNPGTSQSDNQGGTENQGGGIAIEDISIDNWEQVIKDNFGLTISAPDGWTVSKASSGFGAHVTFACNTSKEDAYAFLEGIFSDLKEMAVNGIYDHYDYEKKPLDSIEASGYADAFHLEIDDERGIYYNYTLDDAYNSDGSSYIESVKIYLKQEGTWN